MPKPNPSLSHAHLSQRRTPPLPKPAKASITQNTLPVAFNNDDDNDNLNYIVNKYNFENSNKLTFLFLNLMVPCDDIEITK